MSKDEGHDFPELTATANHPKFPDPPATDPPLPQGILKIDGKLINQAAVEAAETLRKVRWLIEEVATYGLLVTPTIFGVAIPITIRLNKPMTRGDESQ